MENKKYQIIYADPPWKYGFWYQSENVKRNAADHYQVMSREELELLPIEKISDKDSILLMWIIYPCLEEGLNLMKVWGFKYKTVAFTWIKKNKKSNSWFVGLGNYTRANAEICLLGTKGRGLKRINHAVRQIIDSPIREHSQKPEEAKIRIVELFGNLPRIELFARQKTEGWDVWGNEVKSDIDLKEEYCQMAEKQIKPLMAQEILGL